MVRALERGSTWWLVLAFALVGFGFLTKMLQAFARGAGVRRSSTCSPAAEARAPARRGSCRAAGVALLASAGWWVAIVELWPASTRPYIGGSQNNSILEPDLRLQRLRPPHRQRDRQRRRRRGGRPGVWGATGLTRLFGAEFGGQISWLLPAALILLVAGLVVARPRGRAPTARVPRSCSGAAGSLVTGLVFSLGEGIIHPYYSVALAPGDRRARRHRRGACCGSGATTCRPRAVLAARRGRHVDLGLRPARAHARRGTRGCAGRCCSSASLVAGAPAGRAPRARPRPRGARAGAIAVVLAAPAGYTLATVDTPHTGAIPTAGPAGARRRRGSRRRRARRLRGAAGGTARWPGGRRRRPATGATRSHRRADGAGGRSAARAACSTAAPPSAALTAAARGRRSSYTWVAATVGANQAAGYQLATGDPVMAIGGFNGTDPTPTLAQFEQYVREGQIHYFIGGGGGGGGGGGTTPARRRRSRRG